VDRNRVSGIQIEKERLMETKILFVDGDRGHAQQAVRGLSRKKPEWHLLLAHSCKEAKMMFHYKLADAAVIDMSLPDGSGLDLMEELMLENPSLPVILISGEASEELRIKILEAGGYALMSKPCSEVEMIENIEGAVKRFPAALDPRRPLDVIAESGNGSHALSTFPASHSLVVYRPNRLDNYLWDTIQGTG
jgi:DNA-binding response OmpR family regulator